MINRPLQWLVCVLHLNELLLKHLFEKLDGPTSGPESYTGPLGKLIGGKGLVRTPLVNFEPIPTKIEEVDYDLDNNDTKLFYRLSFFVSEGHGSRFCSAFNEKPGKVTPARWVTCGSNQLMLFCQTEYPTNNQKKLIKFIQGCYGPMLYLVKQYNHAIYGARLFFEMILLAKSCLNCDDFKIVKKVLEDNSYFAHPENILLSMVFDENRNVRKKGAEKIIESRNLLAAQNYDELRHFRVPGKFLNLNARNYYEVLDLSKMKPEDCDPPLLKHFSIEKLRSCIDGDQLKIDEFPCHSQAVERNVALTSRSSENNIGYTNRHGFILSTQDSFAKLPMRATKSHFVG